LAIDELGKVNVRRISSGCDFGDRQRDSTACTANPILLVGEAAGPEDDE
jgi:hypothetical protein